MIPFLIKHVVYPVHGIATGRPILKCAAELEKTQWLSHEELAELQWRKLRSVLSHAAEKVPYYRRAFGEAGVDVGKFTSPQDLARLPVLTKAVIRANQSDLIGEGASMSRLKQGSSSGSTGENVVFYHDANCRGNFLGAVVRNHRWCGADVGELEVRIWGSAFDLTSAARWTGRLKSLLQNVRFISAYELKPDLMAKFTDDLRKWKPAIITAYAVAAEVFAKYLLEHGISDIRPKGVICSAEALFPHQREVIESAFGCKVFNRYGCREFGDIAQECDHGGFHVNMERVFVEVVPEDGCPEGLEPGELLVTDLDNYGMPMIRYRIGDIASHEDPAVKCECGRGLVMLREVQGRTMDAIRTSSGRMLPGTFWTILTKSVPGIVQFQIVQKDLTHIVLNLKTDKTFPRDSIPSLEETVKEYCGAETRVDINLVDHIEPGPSGKFRFVISELR